MTRRKKLSDDLSVRTYGTPTVLTPGFVLRLATLWDWEARYAGYRWDAESGLYQVRNRVLQPLVGWVQRDPLFPRQRRGKYDPNPYRYVRSHPLLATDPLGLEDTLEACMAGLGSIGTGVAVPAFIVCVGPIFLAWRTQRGKQWTHDKWVHCVATCQAAKRCTNVGAILGAIFKEFIDCLWPGWSADLDDVKADVKGIECAGWETFFWWPGVAIGYFFREDCKCCCDKHYKRFQ
jgi:RHS repeat-associated protein